MGRLIGGGVGTGGGGGTNAGGIRLAAGGLGAGVTRCGVRGGAGAAGTAAGWPGVNMNWCRHSSHTRRCDCAEAGTANTLRHLGQVALGIGRLAVEVGRRDQDTRPAGGTPVTTRLGLFG
jgi:hypothetical protein